VSLQFGKYGVIKQEDFYNKKPEFLMWAMEVKKEDTNCMGQMKMKELFKEFIEDYNTATMPSKKYYNLTAWENQQIAKRSKKQQSDGMTDAQRAALASFDDEKARIEEMKVMREKKQEQRITDELRMMKQDKTKAQAMISQDRLATQRDMLNKAGLNKEAQKINEKLT